ncbi:MAG: FeoB-associated Cys-rich membrane protein [Clostridia bacterium]|nr:FeoB-associated Cys-rich membrane protein [Clostridia bacterium]
MSLGSWIVFGAVLAAFAAVIITRVRSRKRGGSCGCSGCSGCTAAGSCPHSQNMPPT